MLCPQNIIERNKKEKSQLLIEKKMLNGAAMLFEKNTLKKLVDLTKIYFFIMKKMTILKNVII